MITRKRCVLCNHERREDIERMLEDMSLSPDEVDREYNWPSGTTSKHQRNHMTGYSKSSNPRCVICTSEGRSELEVRLHEGSVTPDDVANCAIFLASDLSSYISGRVFQVDGGMLT